MQKVRSLLKSLLASDNVKRVLHTLWQVAVPVFLSHIVIARSSADIKAAFVITGATVLATLKAILVARS